MTGLSFTKGKIMRNFAVVDNGEIVNLILVESLEMAEQITGMLCFEYSYEDSIAMGDTLEKKKLKTLKEDKTKRDAKIIEEQKNNELERIRAIEAENERFRALEAARLAAEEAAKPKPVTGVFVRVEKN